MLESQEEGGSATTIASEIRIAQARAVLHSLTISIWANCFIALTTAAILWLHQPSLSLLYWLAAVCGLNFVRILGAMLIDRYDCAARHTELTLRLLSLAALLSGCLWAVAPFLGLAVEGDRAHAYVIFIIAGICAGSIIQSTAYSRVAIVFGAPQMLAAVASLLMNGSLIAFVVSVDVLLLMVMMFRSSRMSEKNFIASHGDRLKAVSLARSLSKANAEIRSTNQQLEILASRDPLTGLGNRAAFNLGLADILERNHRDSSPVALMIIDLDGFKSINDTMGHSAGDAVLVELARRLRATAGGDLVVRLGGDEFAVVTEGPDAYARGRAFAAAFISRLDEPMIVDGREVTSGASVGLALFPDHARLPHELFACADIALYAAKDRGRRRICIFDPEMKRQLDRQRQLEVDVRQAIAEDDIKVFFQPQVALGTGAVSGFEALIRWTHPVLGPVAPPEIVRAARSTHASEALTRHVALAAAKLVHELPSMGLADVCVAINVSPAELSAYSLSGMLRDVVELTGIDPSSLEIEITEEAMLDTAAAGPELGSLERMGFRIAVDDFGMGHSSLAYLMDLKVDRLKIDRSFVSGIADSRSNQALVSALVGMGHALSIDIVVEGVETAEDAEVLRMLGCRYGQGYLFGRPMPLVALRTWVAAHADAGQATAVGA
ncbi:putative bifunctional diguanylate cyclase/phosphodiesterase [Pseudorhizobium sp. NPDC055634]